jgi:hypothetical protein
MINWRIATLLKMLAFPVALVIIGATIFVSFGSESFYSNLSFAMASIGVNIIITVFVIDWLMSYRRKQQWMNVRSITLRAIMGHLCDITAEIYVEFSVPGINLSSIGRILNGRNTPNAATPEAFEEFASELEKIHQDIQGKSPSSLVVQWWKKIQWDLDQIQNVLTWLAITSSSDQTLIDALVAFDQVKREFVNGIHSHQMAVTQEAFPALVKLVRGSGRLYATVASSFSNEA